MTVFFGGWHCAASAGRPQHPAPVGTRCGGCCGGFIGAGDAGAAIASVLFEHETAEDEAFRNLAHPQTYTLGRTLVTVKFTVFHGECLLHHLGLSPCTSH